MGFNKDFPNGFVECSECGRKYDSLEVYLVSHTAPDYEWVGGCGHARLKWKNAPKTRIFPKQRLIIVDGMEEDAMIEVEKESAFTEEGAAKINEALDCLERCETTETTMETLSSDLSE